jgi:hypothetical protein
LEVLFGSDAGLSASTVQRLTEASQTEHAGWVQPDLSGLDYVYCGDQFGETIRDKISEAHEAVTTIRSVTTQIDAWQARSDLGDARAAADKLKQKLSEIEGELINPGDEEVLSYEEPARLNEKLASLIGVIASADAPPPNNH